MKYTAYKCIKRKAEAKMINQKFEAERKENIAVLAQHETFNQYAKEWVGKTQELKYSNNFDWVGLPMVECPKDIVDIDICAHNRTAIEAHPMSRRLHMTQRSSINADIIVAVHERANGRKKISVCLDSNHTHAGLECNKGFENDNDRDAKLQVTVARNAYHKRLC